MKYKKFNLKIIIPNKFEKPKIIFKQNYSLTIEKQVLNCNKNK
jgi:hypothetical protein